MSAVNERLRRMGLLPGDDFGGAVPAIRIEYVNRFLYDDEGTTVGAKVLDDRIQVCGLYSEKTQERAINAAISLISST